MGKCKRCSGEVECPDCDKRERDLILQVGHLIDGIREGLIELGLVSYANPEDGKRAEGVAKALMAGLEKAGVVSNVLVKPKVEGEVPKCAAEGCAVCRKCGHHYRFADSGACPHCQSKVLEKRKEESDQ